MFARRSNGISPSSLLMLPGNGTGALGARCHEQSINIIADTNDRGGYESRDGMPDAVLAGYSLSASPQLSVLINQGNGTFAGEKDYALPDAPVSLAVGDFNGDLALWMSQWASPRYSRGRVGQAALTCCSVRPTARSARLCWSILRLIQRVLPRAA